MSPTHRLLLASAAVAAALLGPTIRPAQAQLGFLRKMMEDPTKIGSYLDPTRPENYPRLPGGSSGGSDSQIQVMTDPSIGPDGRVYGGSSSGGGSGPVIGQAQAIRDGNGLGYWVYGNMRERAPQFDHASSPVPAPQPPPPAYQPPVAPPAPQFAPQPQPNGDAGGPAIPTPGSVRYNFAAMDGQVGHFQQVGFSNRFVRHSDSNGSNWWFTAQLLGPGQGFRMVSDDGATVYIIAPTGMSFRSGNGGPLVPFAQGQLTQWR